jgi:hypothetical protein
VALLGSDLPILGNRCLVRRFGYADGEFWDATTLFSDLNYDRTLYFDAVTVLLLRNED